LKQSVFDVPDIDIAKWLVRLFSAALRRVCLRNVW